MKTIIILLINILFLPAILLSQDECKITYVSNEGFLIELDGKKILIDALFDKIDGDWCDSPTEEMLDLLENSKPPFDNIDIIAITHKHRDHFDENVVVKHLLSNPKAIVICPDQVGEILLENPANENFSDRIISFTPRMCNDTSIFVSGIPVRFIRLEHSCYLMTDTITGALVNKHCDIENLGFLFNIKEKKIFHCGDTNPINEKEYSVFSLIDEDIDIAFLERQFLSNGKKGTEIINKYIHPKNIIFMHIKPANQKLFLDHVKGEKDIKIFENKMDSFVIKID